MHSPSRAWLPGKLPDPGRDTRMALGQRGSSTQPQPTGGAPPSTPAGPPPYNWRATLWLIIGILVVVGAMGVFMRVIPTPFTQPAPTAALTPRPTAQAAVSAPV